jgi:hypothetical protein
MESNELGKQYSEKAFELEFWKSRVGATTPESEFGNGLKLYRELCDIEKRIKQYATGWLQNPPKD